MSEGRKTHALKINIDKMFLRRKKYCQKSDAILSLKSVAKKLSKMQILFTKFDVFIIFETKKPENDQKIRETVCMFFVQTHPPMTS